MLPSDRLLEKFNQFTEEEFPSTHIYANTMAYILNAPHAMRKDKKLWKPEEFYDMEKALEYEIKQLVYLALKDINTTEIKTSEEKTIVAYAKLVIKCEGFHEKDIERAIEDLSFEGQSQYGKYKVVDSVVVDVLPIRSDY